jgi:hypothetical protein
MILLLLLLFQTPAPHMKMPVQKVETVNGHPTFYWKCPAGYTLWVGTFTPSGKVNWAKVPSQQSETVEFRGTILRCWDAQGPPQ